MSDKPWKAFEREAADLIQGKRFWSNSGEACDIEGPYAVGQCKHVRSLSLNALCELAEIVAGQAAQRFKAGLVIVKNRPGPGKKATTVVCMTAATWRALGRGGLSDEALAELREMSTAALRTSDEAMAELRGMSAAALSRAKRGEAGRP